MTLARFVDLEAARPSQAVSEAVVVIDVLRAFTTAPWMLHRGAVRLLAVAEVANARSLRARSLPHALLAGEVGGRPLDGFDLGNSPSEVAERDLRGATVVHRTSAGTQGLLRTVGSRLVFAASFVTAAATAVTLRSARVGEVTYVVTGASLGRDGDEDLACAELIAARVDGDDPDPGPYLTRVANSDAGRMFGPEGPSWAPSADLAMACELDRFDHALRAEPVPEFDAVQLRTTAPRRPETLAEGEGLRIRAS